MALTLICFRLYCDPIESDDRLACTATLQAIFETLLKHIAPILPHLAEEAFSFYSLSNFILSLFINFTVIYLPISFILGNTTFFKSSIISLDQIVISDGEKILSVIENALMVKSKVSNVLQGQNSLEYSIILSAPSNIFDLLKV